MIFKKIFTVLYETIKLLICSMFGSVLECYELTGVGLFWTRRALANKATIRHRYQERKVVKFNTKLEGRCKDKLISMEELEDDRSLVDKKEGIHLTPQSSQMVATLIENHIKKT